MCCSYLWLLQISQICLQKPVMDFLKLPWFPGQDSQVKFWVSFHAGGSHCISVLRGCYPEFLGSQHCSQFSVRATTKTEILTTNGGWLSHSPGLSFLKAASSIKDENVLHFSATTTFFLHHRLRTKNWATSSIPTATNWPKKSKSR